MEKEKNQESFEAFIKSFFYGKRTDLSFKFLSDLTVEDASTFIQNLFKDIVDSIDDKDLSIVKQRMLQGQIEGYKEQNNFEYDDGPFHPFKKPLSSIKLSLLTSSGHFLKGRDPKPLGVEKMSQEEAVRRVFDFLKEEPQLSEIPFDSNPKDLMVRHSGYDIRAALKDPNVSFPYQRMVNLKDQGVFAELTSNAYSFVGACSQVRLLKKTLPDWVDKFVDLGIDAVVLVPVWPVCHMSVGHVARALEEAKIATVIIAVKAFETRMRMMSLPRVLLTPQLLGRPLGSPFDEKLQIRILNAALQLLEKADRNKTIQDYH